MICCFIDGLYRDVLWCNVTYHDVLYCGHSIFQYIWTAIRVYRLQLMEQTLLQNKAHYFISCYLSFKELDATKSCRL